MRRLLEREIRNFVRTIDENIFIDFKCRYFECDWTINTIYIPIHDFMFEMANESIINDILKENSIHHGLMTPMFSILHEVGHIMTIPNYTSPKSAMRQHQHKVEGLRNLFETLEKDEILRKYKGLKVERDADEWAYNFYKENRLMLHEVNNKIRKIILKQNTAPMG